MGMPWVKGPAKQIDIDRGRTSLENTWGNNGADEMVVAGAAVHQLSPDVVASARGRKDWAIY